MIMVKLKTICWGAKQMKNNDIKNLKTSEISSDVFVISPTLLETISKNFGLAVAEEMNVRPLAHKIEKIASDVLTKVLRSAKTMGQ